jgi:hypothetical protein
VQLTYGGRPPVAVIVVFMETLWAGLVVAAGVAQLGGL